MKSNKLIQDLLAKAFLPVFAIFSLQVGAQTTPVSVFNYPGLNGSSGCDGENANLISIIGANPAYTVDGSITSFSNSATLATQLDASEFFFMTDMETQNPSDIAFLPVASRDVIKNWVNAGGVIVMTGTYGTYDTNFLNLIFSWNLGTVSGSSWTKNTANTVGTPFENGPLTLPAPSATDAISKGTVPNFKSMWGTDSNATVAVIKYGAGSVIFMGYDFYDAGTSCAGYSSTWVQSIIPTALKYAKELSSSVDNITYTTADVKYTFTEIGSTYYLLVPSGSTAPTNAQIEAGVDYSGVSVITSDNSATTAFVEHVFNLTGLVYNTSYDCYTVTKYNLGAGNLFSKVKKISFNTLDNDSPVGSSIANKPLLCPGTPSSAIALTITDAYPGDSTFTVTGSSSNTSLVSNSNIAITGTGNSRSISITPTAGIVGVSTISINITDSLSKSSTVSFTVNYGDVTAPTIGTLSAINVNADTGDCTYASSQLTAPTASDNCSLASVIASPASLVLGANLVTWTATDAIGLTKTSTQTVTVKDTQNPTIATLGTISVNADLGVCSYVSSQLAKPTAGDNCSVASVIASPANLVVGSNNVTWTATDGSGNIATSIQTVIVEDKVAPVVLTKNITIQLNGLGTASIVGTDVNNGSTDVCGIANLSVSPSTFTCANVGNNLVTLTVTDINGNSSSAPATVTIEDKIAPVVAAKNITVQLDAAGNAVIVPSDVDNGSNDACGLTLALNKTSFTCANVGPNTVILTATDSNTNVSSATAIVTVEDKTPATVLTKNITVQLDATGIATIIPSDVDNGSNDACGLTLTLDKTSFTCANVGDNTVTLTATDSNGNVSSATAIVTVEDKIAATVLTKNITVQLDATGNATIAPSDVDNGSNDACGLTLALDKTSFTCANVGNNTVTLTATDSNGNVSSATATVKIEDKIAPVVAAKNITVQLDAAGNATIVPSDVDNGSNDACGLTLALDKTSFTCANVGDNTVTLTATDANGNISSATAIVTVEDKTPATVLTKNITVQLNATGNAVIVPSDVDNGSNDACGIATLALDKTSFTCANVGPNTVTLTATDSNGNVSSATATVKIEDKIAPAVLTKNIIVQLNAAGIATIIPSDVDNGSNDACGLTLALNKTSFTCANVGNNTVTLTATDSNGNVSSATAVVTIENKIKPVVATKNITVQLNASGNVSITAADLDGGSTVVCGTPILTLSAASFTCANIGNNTVTLTVTDANGNSASKTATVTIENKIAPLVLTKNLTIQLDASGNASITANQIDNRSSQACGIASITVSPNTFSCNNVGANIVTLTVTDVNGNTATAKATVTVQDGILPTVKTKDITVELDDAGNASVTANQINNGSSDNCGIATVTLSKVSFDCTNVGANTVVLTVKDKNGNTASSNAIVTVKNTFGDNDNDGILDNCDNDDDNDNILDSNDNCPITYNPLQEDRNHNGLGDACDKDQMNISQAITPNGDGINDTWVITNIEIHPNSVVRVFNRWGAEVFFARNYQNDWDGHSKNGSGTLPESSSYYYQVDLDGDGTIEREGWIYINK